MRIKYLVLTAVLATAIFGFGIANAQSSDDITIQNLLVQIAQLQAQLQALQAGQGTTTTQAGQGTTTAAGQGTTTTPAWCHDFNKNLRVGDSGKDVHELAYALKSESVLLSSFTDGDSFDEGLASAVSKFQEKYASEILTPSGLEHGNGYVGPATRKKLNALYGCTVTSCAADGSSVYASSAFGPTKCCSKNAGIKPPEFLSNGVCVSNNVAGLQGTCVSNWWRTCGDGVCARGDEDKCNCPKDCGTITTTPSITVTSPNGGETLQAGSAHNITWNVSGFPKGGSMGVFLYESGQYNPGYLRVVIKEGASPDCPYMTTVGTGVRCFSELPTSYAWTPNAFMAGSQYRIETSLFDASNKRVATDQSDRYFSIATAGTTKLTASSATIIGSQSTYNPSQVIKFSVKGIASDGNLGTANQGFHVQYRLCTSRLLNHDNMCDSSTTVIVNGAYQVGNAIYNSATGYWDIASIIAPSDTTKTYYVEAGFYCSTFLSANSLCADSEVKQLFAFTIAPTAQPSITVTSPNGGEKLTQGQIVNISWNSTGLLQSDKINIWLDDHANQTEGGATGYMVVVNLPGNSTSYQWTIPANQPFSEKYRFSVRAFPAQGNGSAGDDSDNYFTIAAASSGSFATALDGSTPVNQTVAGNQSVVSGKFKFTAEGQNYTLTELRFRGNGNESVINSATLKDGSNVLGTVPFDAVNGYFRFSGLSVSVPANTFKVLSLTWNLGSGAGTNLDTKSSLIYAKYIDRNGTVSEDTNVRTANSTIVSATISQPAMRVDSPNGGETLQAGGTHNITWSLSNFPAGGSLGIFAYKAGVYMPGYLRVLIKSTTAADAAVGCPYTVTVGTSAAVCASELPTSYAWNLPALISGNDYKIEVSAFNSTGKRIATDQSDNNFTIAASTALLNIQGQIAALSQAILMLAQDFVR